jgi:hypothetical protein
MPPLAKILTFRGLYPRIVSDRETTTPHVESPEEAFSILGNDTRLSVLLELTRVAGEGGASATLSFSELQQRVGVDDSGRFNYHLDQLGDDFIAKDDGEYRARYPGLQVVSSIYAGLYNEPDRMTAESDYDCPQCERSLQIAYRDLSLALECPEHGLMTGYPVPPGAFEDRTLEAVTTVMFRRAIGEIESGVAGVCQRCWGTVEAEWPAGPPEWKTASEDLTWVGIACDRCWLNYKVPYRTVMAAFPAVRGFYTENGYDEIDAFMGPVSTSSETVCSITVHDDRRVTTTIELGDTLSITLDEEFDIVEQTRNPSE